MLVRLLVGVLIRIAHRGARWVARRGAHKVARKVARKGAHKDSS